MIERKDNPFLALKGVGAKIAALLAKLNLHTLEDLLLHFPVRYQNKTNIIPMNQLIVDQEMLCEGTIVHADTPRRGKTKLFCRLQDDSGVLNLRFFHILSFQKNSFSQGTRLRVFGEVRLGLHGLEMIHPEIQVLSDNPQPLPTHLTPIYPATLGLKQAILRKIADQALTQLDKQLFPELLPESLLAKFALPTLAEAIKFIHRPPASIHQKTLEENKTKAQQRIIIEELLAHRVSLLQMKNTFRQKKCFSLKSINNLTQHFINALPFQLTNAQQKAIKEINYDLMQANPMLRLLQGDVGAGKTIVAACAILQAIENGYQAALMAPTEILAEQHYRTFTAWFKSFSIQIAFLSGANTTQVRKAAQSDIAEGKVTLVIGTHALFQAGIQFKKLALIVIDEQHRFGVSQRALLREKGEHDFVYPHQLMMTATPIPRTLALSFYADLDCSVLNELPPGRTPIMTSVIPNHKRLAVIEKMREVCQAGRQVYWVCPLIDESDLQDGQAAIKVAEELAKALPTFNIGLIHGRMRAVEKEIVMKSFQAGDIHLLVATTVIEVGVDVPNASVIVIENAERLGLSQLHQLRGRVGRGKIASYCILLHQPPLTDIAKERLGVMRETTDGFQIAERDLILRGPGEVLGTRQTGDLSLRVADLLRDTELLPIVTEIANEMLSNHPEQISPLIERWFKQPLSEVVL